MNLTTEELIKLVEDHDAKASCFENKIITNTEIEYSEIDEYTMSTVLVLLLSMKLNTITADEMLEKCLNNLQK